MRSSSEIINIASSAQKLDVDNRISLRYYYRIADNILKQVIVSDFIAIIHDLFLCTLNSKSWLMSHGILFMFIHLFFIIEFSM